MSRMERDKGARIEREIVTRHKALGVFAKRVPMSGASAYTHDADVDVYPWGQEAGALVAELKARGSGEGFKTLERWLADNDLLFLWRDRQQPLVVVPWRVWERILEKVRA